MANPDLPRADDVQILKMLHLMDRDGMTAAQVAARFHTTRSAVLGLRYRCLNEADTSNGTVKKKRNLNGAMGPKWWAK